MIRDMDTRTLGWVEFAPRWRRLVAFVLDFLFICIVNGLFFNLGDAWWLGVAFQVAYMTVGNVVGLTPGKYYLRTMTVRRDGSRPGLWRGVVRSLWLIVPSALLLASPTAGSIVLAGALLGNLLVLTRDDNRSAYDLIAGTWVVSGRRRYVPSIVIT
jgi:uncharacterized RDD family membrane protein YckC